MPPQIPITKSTMPPFEEYIKEIEPLWQTRWLTNCGQIHSLLECKLQEHLNVENVTLFSNGHMALEAAFNGLNITEGEVITTPFTFISTTHAIVRMGLAPVFCDVNPADYTIDTSLIEKLITPKTKAIMPVHVYGNICDYKEIDRIAKKHSLKVIYDAAHAFYETVDGINVAALGDVSMFSFHATKIFHSVEGGALTYNDSSYKEKFELFRNFGIDNLNDIAKVAPNAKMSEFHAAMGLCNLRHIDAEIKRRKHIALCYESKLDGVPGIKLIISHKAGNISRNYSYFPVIFHGYKYSREQIFHKLKEAGIVSRRYFYPLTFNAKCYKGKFTANTPVAEHAAENVLALPMYGELSEAQIEKICGIILS